MGLSATVPSTEYMEPNTQGLHLFGIAEIICCGSFGGDHTVQVLDCEKTSRVVLFGEFQHHICLFLIAKPLKERNVQHWLAWLLKGLCDVIGLYCWYQWSPQIAKTECIALQCCRNSVCPYNNKWTNCGAYHWVCKYFEFWFLLVVCHGSNPTLLLSVYRILLPKWRQVWL